MNTQFTARLYDTNNKAIASKKGCSAEQLMLKILPLLDILPLGTRGIIYDNHHNCIVGQYTRRSIE